MVNGILEALKTITVYDFLKAISTPIAENNQQISPDLSQDSEKEKFITGKQVDDLLQISSVTRFRYAKEGILTRHKISPKKVMYKRSEVLKLLAASEL